MRNRKYYIIISILRPTTLQKFINKLLSIKIIIIKIKDFLPFKSPAVELETSLNCKKSYRQAGN